MSEVPAVRERASVPSYIAEERLGTDNIAQEDVQIPRLALAHMIGHAIVRTLQFLRAPSMLHDYHRVHAAAGGHLATTGDHYHRMLPESVRLWAYRFALDRGFYDAFVHRLAVSPVLRLSQWLASFEPGTKVPVPGSTMMQLPEVNTLERTNA